MAPIPLFFIVLSAAIIFLTNLGDLVQLSSSPMVIHLSSHGSLRVEEPVKIKAKISQWSEVDELEIILSSEEFHEIHPGKNLLFPEGEEQKFEMKPFLRSKTLSRTRQKFSFKRISPSTLGEASLVYRSPMPQAAITYSLEVHVRTQENSHVWKNLELAAKPGPAAFVFCTLRYVKRTPSLRCTVLDRRGNESQESLSFKGKLPGARNWKSFEIQGSQNIALNSPPPVLSRFEYLFQGRRFYSNALPEPDRPIFFGDLHTHSRVSDSRVPISPGGLLNYAKRSAHLDFMAVTDHAEPVFGPPLSKDQFDATRDALRAATQSGDFSPFLGFEWTSTFHNPKSPWGHRTVIYPDLKGKPYRSDKPETDAPSKLYQATGKVFSFPHHSMISWGAFGWDRPIEARYEKGVEVYSAHGNSLVADRNQRMQDQDPRGAIERAIKKRYPLKLLAASDTHAGHPGLNNWPGLKPGLMDGGGLTAVFAKKNTRRAIFQSLISQRFYATSGTRILLYPASENAPFPLRVYATHPLKTAVLREFIKDGPTRTRRFALKGLDESVDCQLTPETYAYYITVIQTDGEKAWMGPWYRSP